MKYCPYCGADIPDDAVSFCAECGKALPAKKEKTEKSTLVKKSSAGKKKKHKSSTVTDAELRKAYNDGYDGYLVGSHGSLAGLVAKLPDRASVALRQ